MNENDQTGVPPLIAPAPQIIIPPSYPKPLSWWLKKFFASNPFYLVSAMLLLYGCYRVLLEPFFFSQENARLLFNFVSVQTYEVLLVLIAIFLAGRKIWYDSTLLVGLENLLVFVPFILVSQASLINVEFGRILCAAGMAVIVLRFATLKTHFTRLNLPIPLLVVGFVMLSLNVALPLIYRHFGETKFGYHMDTGGAYYNNRVTWLLILPAALALVNFLPRAAKTGDLEPEHPWLPTGLFSLWLVITGIHVYSLDYVYEFLTPPEHFAPLAWVLAWTVYFRCTNHSLALKYMLTIPALLTPVGAALSGGDKIYLALCALNIAAYTVTSMADPKNRLAPHFIYASGLMLVAGLPIKWVSFVAPGILPGNCAVAALALYAIAWIAWLRNPALAAIGAFIVGGSISIVLQHYPGAVHWAFQGAFIFLLLHSLRWNGVEHPKANVMRHLVAFGWIIQSFVWMQSDAARLWMPCTTGALVIAAYCLYEVHRKYWSQFTVPAAALVVMVTGPCTAAVNTVLNAPVYQLAVAASFACLAIGTGTALSRHLWHRHELETHTEPGSRVE